MKKRIIALFLCIVSVAFVFAGCAKGIDPTSEYKGQQITMYLTENVYDLDPANAYINDSTRSIVSLLFDTLFTLDENGKVKPSLAESYKVEEKKSRDGGATEYYMYITIKETYWSDGTPVTADDVVYAWKRLLSYNDSYAAASLLFDVKNARAYNKGDVSKDDIGLTADKNLLTIQFEGAIDYEQFVLNTTSLALAPLREDVAGKGDDWAKKPGTMVCSGPFKLARISFSKTGESVTDKNQDVKPGDATKSKADEAIVNSFILERNTYYYRDAESDEYLDKSVKPYRILVDCAASDEDIKEAYDKGVIMYIGTIPVSLRDDFKDVATVKNSLSTSAVYFNLNNEQFADKNVRQALSMAIDRQAIANKLVFAEVATGIVPTGVFESNSAKSLFRDNASSFSTLSTNETKAKELLGNAKIKKITLTISKNDEVQRLIAEQIKTDWEKLGITVEFKELTTIVNNDYYKYTDEYPSDICDDQFAEAFRSGDFEVILVDTVAVSADPFSVLAPFAKGFSGEKMDSTTYEATPHITGFDSEAYNSKMEDIFKEKNVENRSAMLHEAEKILMDEMPVIPLVFNKTAYVTSDDLDTNNTKFIFWKKSSNYYSADTLSQIQVGDYEEYRITCMNFLKSKFDTYKQNPLSYFGGENFKDLTWEQFQEESSNYNYLFKPLSEYKMSKDD